MSRGKVVLAAIVVLLVVGLFFPVPPPHVSLPAERVFSIAGFPIFNSVIAAWVSMALLIVLGWLATRHIQLVPRGLQNLAEMAIEWTLGLVENVAGKENGRRFFPLVVTIFLFILTSNWMSLVPGFETIGIVKAAEHGPGEHAQQFQPVDLGPLRLAFLTLGTPTEKKDDRAAPEAKQEGGLIEGEMLPLLRAANTDLNTTLGLALVAMFMVEFWGIRTLGVRGYGSKFITLKGGAVGAFVGFMELISEFAKIISLTFRLFGNIFAGHVLLAVIGFLIPWVAILPFFGLELFVGLIQALIFAILTLTFATIAVASHAEHEHGPPGESVSE